MTNKASLLIFLTLFPLFYSTTISAQCNDLIITAIFDGPLDGAPRGIELYAKQNISELSIFSIGSANNGDGSDGEEFSLPMQAVDAGTFLYMANDSAKFHDFFGFPPNFEVTGNALFGFLNGNDAVELFCNGIVADVFGDINIDGIGEVWEYSDGWAYRLSGTGPDGINFQEQHWRIDKNALDNEITNHTAEAPIPLGTYDTFPTCDRLIITGVYDGTLPGGEPQGIELYVTRDIPDLSLYGTGKVLNGGGSVGITFGFPAEMAKANSFLYITTDSAEFHNFFGFAPDMTSSTMTINGDDAVELFCAIGDTTTIDVFGEVNMDGTGAIWEYEDGWAYRKPTTGPDASNFTSNNWTFGGIDALEGGMTNATTNTPFPIGTYNQEGNSCPTIRNIPTGNLANGTYQAADSLTAKSTIPINGNVTFHAGQAITLEPGFHAFNGSQFLASITNCSNAFQETTASKSTFRKEGNLAVNTVNIVDFQVYPNPTIGDMTVNLHAAAETLVQLELVDISGRLIKILQPKKIVTKGVHQFGFSLSELDAGMFWVYAKGGNRPLAKKIVLVK